MAHFDWDPALETGDADIDEQQRRIFALANALEDSTTSRGNDAETVADAVYRLTDYVVQHFADEEAVMKRLAFPGTNAHRSLHEQLTAEVMRFAAQYFNGEDVLPETLAPVLDSWLTQHRQENVRFAEFLKGHPTRIRRSSRGVRPPEELR
jgi:hemerythrin-like metal-binding protein